MYNLVVEIVALPISCGLPHQQAAVCLHLVNQYHLLSVISGAPQRSILGLLLFIITISDLPAVLSSAIILLYADDAKCLMTISTLCDCKPLKDDLTRLSKWCSHWNLN